MQRLKQSGIAKGLEQARHGALLEHSRAQILVSVRGDEDDRNLVPPTLQFVLKVGPGHTWHGDIEDEAFGLVEAIGGKELFRRRERPNRIAKLG